jgi:7-cyano-7-deazaguanine synthase
MIKKSIALLSGGLDSSLNLALGAKKNNVALAITFDYKQKAALNEISASKKLANYYKIPHKVIKIDWLSELSKSALTNLNLALPTPNINNEKETIKSAEKVWVVNRNGLFINIAACFAESLKFDSILVGFNAEEAKTFPDNSEAFIEAINRSLSYSTQNSIKTHSYTLKMNKKDMVKIGLKENLPFNLIWPCYKGGKSICKECESCQRFIKAGGLDAVNKNKIY